MRGSSNFAISIRPSTIELILFLSNVSLSINEFGSDFFFLFSISILFASKIWFIFALKSFAVSFKALFLCLLSLNDKLLSASLALIP